MGHRVSGRHYTTLEYDRDVKARLVRPRGHPGDVGGGLDRRADDCVPLIRLSVAHPLTPNQNHFLTSTEKGPGQWCAGPVVF